MLARRYARNHVRRSVSVMGASISRVFWQSKAKFELSSCLALSEQCALHLQPCAMSLATDKSDLRSSQSGARKLHEPMWFGVNVNLTERRC